MKSGGYNREATAEREEEIVRPLKMMDTMAVRPLVLIQTKKMASIQEMTEIEGSSEYHCAR